MRVAPRPGGGITSASTSLLSRHGRIAVDWRVGDDGTLDVDVTVPDGVTAEVDLVGTEVQRLGTGQHRLTAPAQTSGGGTA